MANTRDNVLYPITLTRLLLFSTSVYVIGYLGAEELLIEDYSGMVITLLAIYVIWIALTGATTRLDGRPITVWRFDGQHYGISRLHAYLVLSAPILLGGIGAMLLRFGSTWPIISLGPFYCIVVAMLIEDYSTPLDDDAMDRLEAETILETRT